ncbi:MAG: DUF4349 domain-containing protein [Solirubrobacteraceae bacterium]
MSRDELNASEREELAALDRILAREPVGEQHLELAALVDSVRAGAPRMDPAFAERLDAQIAGRGARRGRGRGRGRVVDHLNIRRLALASGGLVAAAVAFTIVISSGVFAGKTVHNNGALGRPLSGAATLLPSAAPRATSTTQAPVGTTSGPTAATGQAAAGGANFSATLAPNARLVHQDSTLTLASAPAAMQGVANRIVLATEHQGGVVESSNVAVQGSNSRASFRLQVPSGRLSRLIAAVSSLASVRALNQSTNDITDGYNQEQARLADNVALRAALLKQLAVAPTLTAQAAIQQQLNHLEARIAAEHAELDSLLTQGREATLQVTVLPGAAAKHATIAAGPFTTAFNRALHALEAILAIALVAFAIVLPFALTALALWWGATSVRQRARERAMRTA